MTERRADIIARQARHVAERHPDLREENRTGLAAALWKVFFPQERAAGQAKEADRRILPGLHEAEREDGMRVPIQPALIKGRILVWFSCGAASACAAKMIVDENPDAEVLYCDTLAYEHPDNRRFMADVSRWIGKPIKVLRSDRYTDIFDVFDKTGWLIGHAMARCTIELKRAVREAYQWPGDIHIFGMGADELDRIKRFEVNNPELYLLWPLADAGMDKAACLNMLLAAGIELPAMYRLGYSNNNCIGCVKGGKGYWNKIRRDFPEAFARMAAQERKMGARIFEVYLDELPETAGRYSKETSIECGPYCGLEKDGDA